MKGKANKTGEGKGREGEQDEGGSGSEAEEEKQQKKQKRVEWLVNPDRYTIGIGIARYTHPLPLQILAFPFTTYMHTYTHTGLCWVERGGEGVCVVIDFQLSQPSPAVRVCVGE